MTNDSMRNSARRLRWLGALVLLAAFLCAQTVSFVAREYPVAAAFEFGRVDLAVRINTAGTDGSEPEAPAEDRLGVGSDASRIVRITNTGEHPLWVRVRLDLQTTDAKGGERSDASDLLLATGGDAAWQQGNDGYWYLTTPLEPDQTSAALCRSIQIAGGREAGTTYEFNVRAFGVQSEHNATSVWDAEGWPEA